MPKHALSAFDDLSGLWLGRRPALFLDYDGTLTPIVAKPKFATLSAKARSVLARLASVLPVAIVSGRARSDVSTLVGLPGLTYVGSHGFDIALSDGEIIHPVDDAGGVQRDLAEAERELRASLAHVPHILIEPKPFALSIHYRGVAENDVTLVSAEVDRTVGSLPALRRRGGKKIFELRPALSWDKGFAVLWLLVRLDLACQDVVPVYIGDDETDRDAFAAIRNRGIGIYVGRPEDAGDAPFWLEDSTAVLAFLKRMHQHTADRHGSGMPKCVPLDWTRD